MLGADRPPSTGRFLTSLYDALQSRIHEFKKRDLITLAFALSHLSVQKPRKLLERMCGAVVHKMDQFTPLDMLHLLRSLLIPYTPLPRPFLQKGVKLVESGLDTFHAGQVINYFRLSSVVHRKPTGTFTPCVAAIRMIVL